MQTVIAPRGDARTFLTHFVGGGLDDDRYAVQRFRSVANGDIVPVHADGTRPKGRRKARPTIASLKAAEKMRPARRTLLPLLPGRQRGTRSETADWSSRSIAATAPTPCGAGVSGRKRCAG